MNLHDFFCGEILVRATGNVEAFLSAAAHDGLFLRLPQRNEDLSLCFFASPRLYRKLRFPARRTGVRLHLLRKRGLPFILRPYRYRIGLWLGFIFLLCLLILSSAFIWTVEIGGVCPKTAAAIRETLADHGLRPASLKNRIDAEHLRRILLIEIDSLDWAAVNLYGSRAIVAATEAVPLPETEYDAINHPSDLVAGKDGYILDTRIHQGEQLVFPGAAVCEGEIIASHMVHGTIPGSKELSGVLHYVHAHGTVFARTHGSISMVMPKKIQRKSYDEKYFTQNRYFFAERPIFFSSGYGIPAMKCDKIEERFELSLPGGVLLPVTRRTVTLQPYHLTPDTVSDEEALVCMEAYLKAYLISSAKEGLLEEFHSSLTEESSLWRLDAEYFMTEDIGKVVPLTLTP